MRKFLICLFCLLLSANYSFAAWDKSEPLGTRSPSDLDSYIPTNNTAIDSLLSNFRQGTTLKYASAATVTVKAGQVTCSNSTGATRLFLSNTSDTTVSWANIDAGGEAVSTIYYVYAGTSNATDTTFTCYISTSSSAPSGITYYKRLGSFYNNASGNIEKVKDDLRGIIYQATGTSNITSSGAWADMSDMSITETFEAGDVYICFNAPMYAIAGSAYFRILVDSVELISTSWIISGLDAGWSRVMPITLTSKTTLTSGSHTIKVQWYSNNSTAQTAAFYGNRVLNIVTEY